jgi:hypothetical protein
MTQEPEIAVNGDAGAGPHKALLRLVYIMGIILVLLFLGLVAGIIWKASHRPPPQARPEAVLNLNLAAQEVRQTALDGDRLLITTTRAIIVVDVRRGEVVLRVPLASP